MVLRAQASIGSINPPPNIPDTPSDLTDKIRLAISIAYAIAGVATVVFIIYGGYEIIFSAGDSEKMRKGMNTLTNSVIGLVVIVASALIFNFIAHTLGVEDLVTVLNLPFL